jgi:hypothetical protein
VTTLDVAYLGRSTVSTGTTAATVALSPNLARERVAFDGALREPLRFREAVSALHDVVVGDLRHVPKDRTAWRAWQQRTQARERAIAAGARRDALDAAAAADPVSYDLRAQFRRDTKRYWRLRLAYSDLLRREDPELWRMLTPCDPIVTVADDVCTFEAFSLDESAYGCLSVHRDGGFGASDSVQLGTTNVDYSQALYEQFQELRTYRETRFLVDPEGFTVRTAGRADYREEKIDLPGGWLRGLMQVQVAAGMPATAVELPRELVYSLLAFLRRHVERRSPRALRFELLEGLPPAVVLEPWEQRIVGHGAPWRGPSLEPIRIWGRRRLLVLARVLPLAERVTVHLLGTGLPSFWVVAMRELTLTLGLSGWTANDWTRGSALDTLRPPVDAGADAIALTAGLLRQHRAMARSELLARTRLPKAELAAALDHLAHAGQTRFDLADGLQRWRELLPQPVGEQQIGDRGAEWNASIELAAKRTVRIERREELPQQRTFVAGTAANVACELLVDADGRLVRGKCPCAHHRRAGVRQGACRHLLALRMVAFAGDSAGAGRESWASRAERWFR